MTTLNPNKLPAALVPLLSLADKWGIGDDYEREMLVNTASQEDINELIHCIDHISDEDLYGWLSGPESHNPEPSEEYLAITCLTMAIDSAKLRRVTETE